MEGTCLFALTLNEIAQKTKTLCTLLAVAGIAKRDPAPFNHFKLVDPKKETCLTLPAILKISLNTLSW